MAKRMGEKKKSKLGCCLISGAICIILAVGVVFGGGAFAYNKFAKPIIGLSFGDALGLLTGMYGAKADDIVTNPPGDIEKQNANFINKFKQAAFISPDVEINIDDIISGLLPKQDGAENEQGEQGAEEYTQTGNTYLDQLLETLDFDFSTLKDYAGESKTLAITDKELCALVATALNSAEKIPQFSELNNMLGGELKSVLKCEQVIIDVSENATLDKIADGSETDIKLTLSLNVKAAVKGYAENVNASNTTKQLIKIGSAFLPKTVYLTATIYPYADKLPSVALNDLNDKKTESLNKLLNNVLPDGLDGLLSSVDDSIKTIFKTVDGYAPLTFTPSEFSINPIEAMLGMLDLKNLNEAQLLYMIKFINNAEFNELQVVQNAWTPDDVNAFYETLPQKIMVGDEYVNLLKQDFIGNLPLLPDYVEITADKLNTPAEEMKIEIDYKALAGIINGTVTGLLNEFAGAVEIAEIRENISEDDSKNRKLSVTLKMDVKKYVDELLDKSESMGDYENLARKLINALLPQYLYINATSYLDAAQSATVLEINGNNPTQTREMLSSLSSMLTVFSPENAEMLGYDALAQKVDETLKSSIDKLEGPEGINTDLNFEKSGVTLPSIYGLLNGLLNLESEEETIRESLHGMYDTKVFTAEESNVDAALGTAALVTELEDKFYIKENTVNPETMFEDFAALATGYEDKIVFERLLTDPRTTSELVARINEASLGALIVNSGKLNGLSIGPIEQITIAGTHIDIDGVRTLLTVYASAALTVQGENIAGMLPDTLSLTLTVDITNGYATDVLINNLSDDKMNALSALVGKITKNDEFSYDYICTTISEQVAAVFTELNGLIPLNYESNNIVLGNVYDMIINAVYAQEEAGYDATELKSSVQALYATPSADDKIGDLSSAVAAKLNTGLFLTENYLNGDDIQGGLTALQNDYRTAVRYRDLLTTQQTIADMKIVLTSREAGYLLSKSGFIKVESLPLGSSYILCDMITDETYITAQLHMSADTETLDPVLKKIINPNGMALSVRFAHGDAGKSGVTINEMTERDMEVALALMSKLSGENYSMDSVTESLDGDLKEALDGFGKDNIGIRFGADGMAIDGIFEIMNKILAPDKGYDDNDFKDTLQAVYSPDKFGADEYFNSGYETVSDVNIQLTDKQQSITDKQAAKLIRSAIQAVPGLGHAQLMQAVIADSAVSESLNGIPERYGEYISGIIGRFIIITVEITTETALDDPSAVPVFGEKIVIDVIIGLENSSENIIINGMPDKNNKIIMELASNIAGGSDEINLAELKIKLSQAISATSVSYGDYSLSLTDFISKCDGVARVAADSPVAGFNQLNFTILGLLPAESAASKK